MSLFRFFNMHADEPITNDDTVTCTTAYSKVSKLKLKIKKLKKKSKKLEK